ncbi:MAG TPA: ankyrin repeat domain-containing protein [Longimicrobiales bacterium]|nr:ankyrin repeat domain-containing protein [Longimicrobiales bacterium]
MPLDSLTAAIVAGDVAEVRSLLAQHAPLARGADARGVPVLLVACYHRQEEILGLLLEARRMLDDPLDVHEAAAVGEAHELLIALRIVQGGPDHWSADGFTPLHLAAFFGRIDNARLLIERGADANAVARNPSQVQPLHSAAAARQLEIAGMLVRAGADVNAVQQSGWRPLHAAAAHGDEALVRLLLAAGAEAELGNDQGLTPGELARQNGHEAVACLLEAPLPLR